MSTKIAFSIKTDTDKMENQIVVIRPLTENDAAAFKALRLASIADSPTAVWPTVEEESRLTPEQVKAKLEQTPNQVVFGAFIGDQLAGIAGLRRESLIQLLHKASIWGVFVRPEMRKAGIARQLFACIKAHAQALGVLQIHLSVNAENGRARDLYASLGFQRYGIEPRGACIAGQFYDEEHMCLRLDA